MAVPPLGKYPGAPTDPLGVFLVASKMGLRLEVKAAHMSGSHPVTTSEILAMYRLGQAKRIKCEKCAGRAGSYLDPVAPAMRRKGNP